MDRVDVLTGKLGRGERERHVHTGDIEGDIPVADIGGRQLYPVVAPTLKVVESKLRQLLRLAPQWQHK